jgi:lipid-binding SYLF domain-containing protein
MRRSIFGLCVVAAGLMAGCGTTPALQSTGERELTHSRAMAALADFKSTDPSLQGLLDRAHAYAIFPSIVSAAVGIGGAHGDGEVYRGERLIGYADVSQGSIGVQLGGQKYAEIILFQNESSLLNFQQGTLEFDARATAIAASSGAASTADYSRGVLVFTLPESGLMAQAAVGGQKFRYIPVGE